MVSFGVDDVVRAAEVLPVRPLGGLFPDALTVGGDAGVAVVEPDGVHPLLSAVGQAFAGHRPLVLSPDAVWLTIAQGVAQHVRLHEEELRARLVEHPGRKRIEVRHVGPMPTDAESWRWLVEGLSSQLDDDDFFACDFSTSTDVERMAGQVVLLDAYSPYFSVWLVCVCGIPEIMLTGTVDDWRRIRERVDGLGRFGLERWGESLGPIAGQFVRAAGGDVDVAFWRRIYNPADAYGAKVITGWIARLYPYLEGGGSVDRPNPLLELPLDEPRDLTSGDRMGYDGPGIRSSSVPAMLSRVIVHVNDGDIHTVALHAGLVGVAQDPGGALRPIAGWHLTPAEPLIDDVIDRIIREHVTTPPTDRRMFHASADLAALYRRIGSGTLFDGAWRLRPIAEHGRIYRGETRPALLTIIDLPDGSSIGAAIDATTRALHWLIYRVEPSAGTGSEIRTGAETLLDDPAGIAVHGTSLTLLLTAALDNNGDISHLQTGRLADLDDTPAPVTANLRRKSPAAPLRDVEPDGSELDREIFRIRRAKEKAIDGEDFQRAADLRDREKELLRDIAATTPQP
ncbi:DUF4419 domain-containing protein [Winogradskya humida]|uniref:UVR domain-containing protein n=1 Tax=Winogradskya humida TaxID=113566 RepID=A0ABQ3ZZE2_9ACTN|nr:hypothetical protein Ahu01nite_070540 [Actinoplanes humidus]